MGRRKREPMSEGKRNIIAGLLQEYDIKTAKDIEDIYGFEVSDGMVSDITDRLLPQIEEWQNRPLDEVYPVVFIDAVHFSVRDNGQIKKLAAYVILAVSLTGHKEVLSIYIGENKSAKYWLGVLNELKNRGVARQIKTKFFNKFKFYSRISPQNMQRTNIKNTLLKTSYKPHLRLLKMPLNAVFIHPLRCSISVIYLQTALPTFS